MNIDQRINRLTCGVGKDLLPRSPHHPHEIKVRLETGEIEPDPLS